MLTQLTGGDVWPDKARAFAQTLTTDKDPSIAIQGRTILFGFKIGDLKLGEQDYSGLMNDLKALLANEHRDRGVLDITQTAALEFQQAGRLDDAKEALRLIAAAFKDHADKSLASDSEDITSWLAILDLGLDRKIEAVARNEEGADEALMSAMKAALLETGTPSEVVLEEANSVLGMLEQTGKYQLGIQIAQLVQQAFQNSSDERLKTSAEAVAAGALQRMELVGKPLVIEGENLDGSDFDFSKYKGKVVLVDFWATWCGPCLEELPNIRSNYDAYKAKGFEVVGINLDQDRQALSNFLTSQSPPWVTIRGNEMAKKCGVEAIPFVILLDQNGVVLDLHVRGQVLGEKLKELLGPPAAAPDSGQPDLQPPATDQSSAIPYRATASSLAQFATVDQSACRNPGDSLFFSPTRMPRRG